MLLHELLIVPLELHFLEGHIVELLGLGLLVGLTLTGHLCIHLHRLMVISLRRALALKHRCSSGVLLGRLLGRHCHKFLFPRKLGASQLSVGNRRLLLLRIVAHRGCLPHLIPHLHFVLPLFYQFTLENLHECLSSTGRTHGKLSLATLFLKDRIHQF